MKPLPRLAVGLSALLLLNLFLTPLPAQEKRGGRELLEGVIKAIRDSKRDKEPPRGGVPTGNPGVVDLNGFRSALAGYQQELAVLAAASQRCGTPGIRALAPQIAQLQEHVRFSDAYLSGETQPAKFAQLGNTIEQEWRPISVQFQQFRGLEVQLQNSVANLDGYVGEMWRCLGQPLQPPQAGGAYPLPSYPPIAGPGASASDALVLAGLLDREIESIYDQISLRLLLSLSPQQADRLVMQATRLSGASLALKNEASRSGRIDLLAGSHRALQQEWAAFAAILRAERGLRLDASCDRVDSYMTELGDLLNGTGRFRTGQAPYTASLPPGTAAQGFAQLANLSTRLETLAGNLLQDLQRDGEHFRNDSYLAALQGQANNFLGSTQNFRRFLMRPSVDRSGLIDVALLRQTWQQTAANWQTLSASLDQLGNQVRRAERYFPDLYRTQDDITAIMADIQASVR